MKTWNREELYAAIWEQTASIGPLKFCVRCTSFDLLRKARKTGLVGGLGRKLCIRRGNCYFRRESAITSRIDRIVAR